MKLSHLIIIFVIVTVPINFMLSIKTKTLEQTNIRKIEIDHILDTAIIDATTVLKQSVENNQKLKKEEAVNAFYKTLCVNFGIVGDSYLEKKIIGYIPAIIIVDNDGLYLLSNNEYIDENNDKVIAPTWSAKKPYTYSDNQYLYSFTLNDYLTVYDLNSRTIQKGKQKDLKGIINSEIIQNDTLFDEVRRRTIIETIKREMTFSINNHNLIAKQYGIAYNFSLPVIEEEDWYSTVDDISIIAFFQGIPLGMGNIYYNNYAIGGAKVIKKESFYLQEEPSGITFYHRQSCPLLNNQNRVVKSQKEAALNGALPCPTCKP